VNHFGIGFNLDGVAENSCLSVDFDSVSQELYELLQDNDIVIDGNGTVDRESGSSGSFLGHDIIFFMYGEVNNKSQILASPSIVYCVFSFSFTNTVSKYFFRMGGDGGAKPLGRKYLRSAKTKTKGERANKTEVSVAKYTNCALSDQALQEPVVCCRLGHMFNKVALIEAILAKSVPEAFKHIKGTKDFVTLKFAKNPGFSNDVSKDVDYWSPCSSGKFMCPVTRVEMNGRHPFCVIWKSGVVLSKRSLNEIPHKELFEVAECEFEENDVISLNPDKKEYEKMKSKWNDWYKSRKEKRKRKDEKKKKKKNKKKRRLDDLTTTTAMRSASQTSTEAQSRIENEREKNSVYASLFNKNTTAAVGSDEKKDLFIR